MSRAGHPAGCCCEVVPGCPLGGDQRDLAGSGHAVTCNEPPSRVQDAMADRHTPADRRKGAGGRPVISFPWPGSVQVDPARDHSGLDRSRPRRPDAPVPASDVPDWTPARLYQGRDQSPKRGEVGRHRIQDRARRRFARRGPIAACDRRARSGWRRAAACARPLRGMATALSLRASI